MRFLTLTRFVICASVAGIAFAQDPIINDPELDIDTDFGDNVLEFDFPAIQIGIAEYPDGPTGVTVLRFGNATSRAVAVAVDIRGGAPGFLGNYGLVHAITLAGGSLLGLEAASGVVEGIYEERGYNTDWELIPLVSAGVVFDFHQRDDSIYPDKRLGRAAFDNIETNQFPLGARGAGISATVGKLVDFSAGEPAGQGAAFLDEDGVKIFACVILNAVGVIYDRNGDIVLGDLDAESRARSGLGTNLESQIGSGRGNRNNILPSGNTTLTVVVTNQTILGFDLVQQARQVHSSMARAIQPFHTRTDGDVLWFVSTGAVELTDISLTDFGIMASEVVWDAVLAAHP
ncbi:MAG: P1 family peptidase [Gammaproteobacteria bacterium]|nr:P1 family peptidase [Gammaproteobacteria bacterium]